MALVPAFDALLLVDGLRKGRILSNLEISRRSGAYVDPELSEVALSVEVREEESAVVLFAFLTDAWSLLE